ncbi:SLAC1 anion channel family protein [Candidatus Marinarcus aquaticus]|uniref:C4-dicarboxylate ABC transporter n=1 Tax=Candidatus Marinarcus aquaticus TaxID=2044504 RepID=A0A4Q0XSB0_9BACT|nr:SLAC1 anion channel family protein [Candidatus Marinarcus aquaticus]RXJ60172.1 C4-dicarboxylate ABC transporter [Candidatus Marinarcus aquaticus]
MEQENLKKIPNRLQFFPVMMFAIVMGLSGLTLVFRKAHETLHFSALLDLSLSFLTVAVFIAVLLTYGIKIIKYTAQVKQEFNHPIRINFFAAISISFILVSMIVHPMQKALSYDLFIIGAVLHAFFTFYTLSFWINKSLEIQHSNPAWFIPIVGNLIVPIGGVGFVDDAVLLYFFSIGIFFWIIMLAIILNRIIFHVQFAQKFMPTLFILIAPPSIGLLSYFKLTHELDMFAYILFNLGLFFTLLLLFMYKSFLNIKFFISWWAFTFPLASIALASMLMYEQTKVAFYSYISYFFILFVSLVVLIVAYNTIKHMFKKEICIME